MMPPQIMHHRQGLLLIDGPVLRLVIWTYSCATDQFAVFKANVEHLAINRIHTRFAEEALSVNNRLGLDSWQYLHRREVENLVHRPRHPRLWLDFVPKCATLNRGHGVDEEIIHNVVVNEGKIVEEFNSGGHRIAHRWHYHS